MMVLTGDYLFIGLIILAGMLSLLAIRANLILFRIGAAISWIALAFLFLTNALGPAIATPWVQVVSFTFVVMAFAVLLLQMRTETTYEARGQKRGAFGMRGETESTSYTGWGPKPKKRKSTSAERQAEYKQELRSRLSRRR